MTAPTAPPASAPGNPMPDIYAKRLSDRLQYQQSQIQTLNRAQRVAQLGNSSIEDEWINMYDAAAQLQMRLGKQEDNTFSVKYIEGPPPPVPANPNISPGEGSVRVGVTGEWAVPGTKTPENLDRFDIHASLVQGFVPGPNTAYASVPKTGGVESLPLSNTDWYIKIVAVTQSGVKGGASEEQRVLPLPFTTIAAYSIGAEQLKSLLVLASRLIVGDPTGRRFEMEPNAGFTSWNAQNVKTWYQDPTTGNVTMFGRLMGDPAGSNTNIVFGERDLDGQSTLKFAYGTPVDGLYKNYVAMISRWNYQNWSNNTYGPELRIAGPSFRYKNPYGAVETNRWTRVVQSLSSGWQVSVQKSTSAEETLADDTEIDTGILSFNPEGLDFRMSWANLNDNWQMGYYLPKGEVARNYGAGHYGWKTKGSGYEWLAGFKYSTFGDRNSAATAGTFHPTTGKLIGPDLGMVFCAQPDFRFRDHRDLNDQVCWGKSFNDTCSIDEKSMVEPPPVADGQYLEAARQVTPMRHIYNGETSNDRKKFSIAAEDLADNGFDFMIQKRPGRPGIQNDGHDKKGLSAFEFCTFLLGALRDLDEEMDVLRRAAKVESPRREKRVRGRRSK